MKRIFLIVTLASVFVMPLSFADGIDLYEVDQVVVQENSDPATTDDFDSQAGFSTRWAPSFGVTGTDDVKATTTERLEFLYEDSEYLPEDGDSIGGLKWLQNTFDASGVESGDSGEFYSIFQTPSAPSGMESFNIKLEIADDPESTIMIGILEHPESPGDIVIAFTTNEELFSVVDIDWGVETGSQIGMKFEISNTGYLTAWYDLDVGETPNWLELTTTYDPNLYGTGDESFNALLEVTYNPSSVPEPSTIILLLLGICGLGWKMKKKK